MSVIDAYFLNWNQNEKIGQQSEECRQLSNWRCISVVLEEVVAEDGERNHHEELIEQINSK